MASDVKAGDWCYGIRCASCDEPIAVWLDTSRGRDPIQFDGTVVLEIVCPGCGRTNRYRPQQVRHFRALRVQSVAEPSHLPTAAHDDEV